MKYYKRLFCPPKQSFFLFGPRGTGKSTLIHKVFSDALWIDLLRPDILRSYSARPERLFEIVHGNPEKQVIVIDEVQKIPSLLTVVHALIEEQQGRGRQFILTGSNSRKLKRCNIDLLGGRALKCVLHPFMAAELGSDFSLHNALHHGLLPLLLASQNPKQSLEAYVGLYLQEEIQAEGLVRNIESFSCFLETISFSHASELNVTNIANDCEVKRKTVENYIEILKELSLAFQLPVFSKRAQRALTTHPKFYLFDAGVFRALRPCGPFDRPEEIDGLALEGLVAQHLLAWNDYSTDKHEIGFWRTRSKVEVDFVVYGSQGIFAIEVKNSSKINLHDLKPLETFLTDYPMAKALYLYRGTEQLLHKNVLCMPVEKFLTQLMPNQSIANFF